MSPPVLLADSVMSNSGGTMEERGVGEKSRSDALLIRANNAIDTTDKDNKADGGSKSSGNVWLLERKFNPLGFLIWKVIWVVLSPPTDLVADDWVSSTG
ncbi:hypothetical protein LR48_Vigan07g200300 [Vigna angularis]|uniref:Uncharacterized protein n=1 Tax=Phaseolus angularis TaxID=3914 RepID=A0A0L9V0L5_PHAAN|nr:hypothetical protein LR48_Vigan07g200300 [Vigna angularis]